MADAIRFYEVTHLGSKDNGPLCVVSEIIGAAKSVTDRAGFPFNDAEGAVSRDELLALDGGSEALSAWERKDDSAYQEDTARLQFGADLEQLGTAVMEGEPAAVEFMQAHQEEISALSVASIDRDVAERAASFAE
jgi:hypothetical protein